MANLNHSNSPDPRDPSNNPGHGTTSNIRTGPPLQRQDLSDNFRIVGPPPPLNFIEKFGNFLDTEPGSFISKLSNLVNQDGPRAVMKMFMAPETSPSNPAYEHGTSAVKGAIKWLLAPVTNALDLVYDLGMAAARGVHGMLDTIGNIHKHPLKSVVELTVAAGAGAVTAMSLGSDPVSLATLGLSAGALYAIKTLTNRSAINAFYDVLTAAGGAAAGWAAGAALTVTTMFGQSVAGLTPSGDSLNYPAMIAGYLGLTLGWRYMGSVLRGIHQDKAPAAYSESASGIWNGELKPTGTQAPQSDESSVSRSGTFQDVMPTELGDPTTIGQLGSGRPGGGLVNLRLPPP